METTGSWTLYRIVRSDPPTERDFWSHKRLGFFYSPDDEHVAEGVSMFDQEVFARRTAVRFPRTGHLIAEVHVPERPDIVVEQTGRAHHYTVWGDAVLLLTFVVRVFPV